MKQKIISILKLTISLSIGFFLIWMVVSKLSPQDKLEISDAFQRANYLWIVLAILLGLISHVSRTIRWKMLIEPLGYKPRFHNTFFAVMIMYLANLAFPRLGEVMRCGVMAKYEKVPVQKALGTMVTERAIDVLSLLIVGILVITFQYNTLKNYLMENIAVLQTKFEGFNLTAFIGIAIVLLILAIIAFIMVRRSNSVLVAKVKGLIKGLMDGVISVRNLKNPVAFIFHSIVIWVMYFAMVTVSFYALEETSSLGMVEGMACLFFGSFAIIAVQGGIGAYPFVISKLLVIYGVAETVGYAFGWIAWAGQTVLILVFGLLSLILVSTLNKSESTNEVYPEHSVQNS